VSAPSTTPSYTFTVNTQRPQTHVHSSPQLSTKPRHVSSNALVVSLCGPSYNCGQVNHLVEPNNYQFISRQNSEYPYFTHNSHCELSLTVGYIVVQNGKQGGKICLLCNGHVRTAGRLNPSTHSPHTHTHTHWTIYIQ